MSKKLYVALLPVLAVVAFALMGAAAQAAPFWEICEKHAGAGTKFTDSACEVSSATGTFEWVLVGPEASKRRVVTFGELSLTSAAGLKITCQVQDRGFVWNPTEGVGKDEITAFENYECKAVPAAGCESPEIRAKGLPWKTELATGPVDHIKGIKVTVVCKGTEVTTFEGELSPKVENSATVFTAATGELSNGTEKAKVEGTDFLRSSLGQLVRAK